MKTIRIEGIIYKIRYTYKRDDGTLWYVLSDTEAFFGKFGDEFPVSQSVSL